MEPASNWYESVTQVYTRMVQLDSPDAFAVVKEIEARCGSRAGMCAAVAIAITKLDLQRTGHAPDMSIYTELLKGYPEALPLLRRAVALCLPTWRVQNAKTLP